MCRALGLSRSGYYAWQERQPARQARVRAKLALVGRIREVHERSRGTYGSPRVFQQLRADAMCCSENYVARLMQQNGIRARCRYRYTVTPQSGLGLAAPNVLQRRFDVHMISGPNRVWAADITFIAARGRWLYLAVVVDLYSRRVVGWHLSESLHQEFALEALKMAFRLRHPEAGLIHHSDRGVQYTGAAYRQLLEEHGAIVSMSGKGNCWDNAVVESFFSTLKKERIYNQGVVAQSNGQDSKDSNIGDKCYHTFTEARRDLCDYIENWYNRLRLHSTLGFLSPVQFEQRNKKKYILN